LTGSSFDAVKLGCTQVSLKIYFLEGAIFTLQKSFFYFGVNPVYGGDLTASWEEPAMVSQDILNILFEMLSGRPMKRILFDGGINNNIERCPK